MESKTSNTMESKSPHKMESKTPYKMENKSPHKMEGITPHKIESKKKKIENKTPHKIDSKTAKVGKLGFFWINLAYSLSILSQIFVSRYAVRRRHTILPVLTVRPSIAGKVLKYNLG